MNLWHGFEHKAPAKLFAIIVARAEQVRDELTAKALAALEQGGDAQTIMQDLAWKLTNRLIHAPTKSLQQAARDGDNERLNILAMTASGWSSSTSFSFFTGCIYAYEAFYRCQTGSSLHERHEEVQALLGDAQTIADRGTFSRIIS